MSSGSIRIIQLPEKSSVNTDDYMAVDSSANGTKKVKFTDLLDNNLSAQNKAADAQATGEAISELNTDINNTNTRIDNMINTQTNAEVTTLWTGTLENKNQSVTLSESIANFDFIDIYGGNVDVFYIRKPVANTITFDIQTQNLSDDASVQFIRWWETGVSISGTTATITKCVRCYWDDFSQHPVVSQATGGVNITRIDGVKIGHTDNDEIVDARVGANGATYPTLGDAIRGQVTDLKSDITAISNQPTLKWNLNESISANGTISASNYTALTDIVPAQSGDRIVYTGARKDVSNNAFVLNIATYKSVNGENDTFVERKVIVPPVILDSEITGYRLHFGRATASGIAIQESDISTYYSVEIYQKFASETEHKELASTVSTNNDDRMIQNRGWAYNAMPVVLSGDWTDGFIDEITGQDGSSDYQIRTPFYTFKGKIIFNGVLQGDDETYSRAVWVYFYDENREFISRKALVVSGSNVSDVPSDAYYIRFAYGFPISSGITVSNYGKANLIADWDCSFVLENDLLETKEEVGAIGAMTAIAETYLNQAYSADNQIVYDSQYGIYTTPVNEQGKKATVCSQFMKSLLMGTPYEFSRYVQDENSISWWSYEYDSSTTAEFDYRGRGYLASDQIAKYCDDKGLLVPFDQSHNNIRAGDIIFWSDDGRDDKYLNIVHCAICLYVYWEGCYIIHAGSNKARPVDGEDVGIEIYKAGWETYTPSYYARLPLIASKYTNKLLFADYAEYTGSYSGTSTSVKAFTFNNLPIGIYSMTWEDDGNGVSYVKLNPDGVNVNIEPCKQGNKYYIIFYATEPISKLDLRSAQGTTYAIKNARLYKGYKTASIM